MLRFARRLNVSKKPLLPDGIRIYAISDVHGCADLLEQMFRVIDRDLQTIGTRRAIQVFMGDYVDRGPDSFRTLELLIERSQKHEAVFLKGNHEEMMLEVLKDPTYLQDWKQFG